MAWWYPCCDLSYILPILFIALPICKITPKVISEHIFITLVFAFKITLAILYAPFISTKMVFACQLFCVKRKGAFIELVWPNFDSHIWPYDMLHEAASKHKTRQILTPMHNFIYNTFKMDFRPTNRIFKSFT